MTDTYLIWKLISLVNFIYIAFVCKAKTDQLTMVCNIYTNIYLQAFKSQPTNTLSTITLFQIIQEFSHFMLKSNVRDFSDKYIQR